MNTKHKMPCKQKGTHELVRDYNTFNECICLCKGHVTIQWKNKFILFDLLCMLTIFPRSSISFHHVIKMLFLLSRYNIALGTNFWNFGLITLVGRTSAAAVSLEAPNLGLATSKVTSARVHSWDSREMIKETKL